MGAAQTFFDEVVKPSLKRFEADQEDKALLWAVLVSLNHMRDYRALDEVGSLNDAALRDRSAEYSKDCDSLRDLSGIANAMKHGASFERKRPRAEYKTFCNDAFAGEDKFSEKNVFACWYIYLDGRYVNVIDVITDTLEYWSAVLGRSSNKASEGA